MRRAWMRRSVSAATIAGLLALAVAACGSGADPDGGSGVAAAADEHLVTLAATVDGYARSAELHEPPDLPAGPVPLVLVLHGLGGDGRSIARTSGFSVVADAEGFLVAYPSGIDKRWHDGSMPMLSGEPDDIAYLRALVDQIDQRHPVDRDRIFVTGFSNGAGMSVRIACDAPDLVAAAAPVSGGTVGATLDDCDPVEPTPVLQVHGTEDPIIRYEGGQGRLGDLRVPAFAVDELAAFWSDVDGCTAGPETPPDPSAVASPDGATTTRVWTDCTGGGEVRFVRIEGGGHDWPDGLAPELWAWFADVSAPTGG